MPTINFKHIRIHNTSQEDGFEELCCQLHSLLPPQEHSVWYRKEGAGGDAGVESYWKNADGSEQCLQAKYFFELGNSQWKQIDESVSTMLKKHPDCTEYILCLPFNLTDRRVDGEKNQKDHWNTHHEKWVKEAGSRQVKFTLWGETQLGEMLTRDDPLFSGRLNYWFNEAFLSSEWFERHLKEAIDNLGQRYTPSMHVELPIANVFAAALRTEKFWESLLKFPDMPVVYSAKDEFETFNINFRAKAAALFQNIEVCYLQRRFVVSAQDILLGLEELEGEFRKFQDWFRKQDRNDKVTDEDRNEYFKYNDLIRELRDHYEDISLANTQKRCLLLTGDGGTGKSHLLADLASSQVGASQPAILLLGQHFTDSEPWAQICQILDFPGQVTDLLGALDAAAQARNCQAMLAIDALNEGAGSTLWMDRLSGLVERVSHYPNITLILSCRTTYVQRVTLNLSEERYRKVIHRGFAGYENLAAIEYMDRRGIARPNAPFLNPEFSNPLFLKTLCDSLARDKLEAVPRGLRGITSIFDYYVESICTAIEARLHLDKGQSLVKRAIDALTEQIAQSNKSYILPADAYEIVERIFSSQGSADRNLLAQLKSEGLFSDDFIYSSTDDEGTEVIRFTYDRYSDMFRARHFINEHVTIDNLEQIFSPQGIFRVALGEYYFEYSGFVEALSILVPEIYNRELHPLVKTDPDEENDSYLESMLKDAFVDSLLWREPKSTNEETLSLLNDLLDGLSDESFNLLIQIAGEPDHAFNASLLHRNLFSREMAERDTSWSAWIAKQWYAPDDNDSNPLSVLLHWSLNSDTTSLSEQRVWLNALAICWVFSSPQRNLRDVATKALVNLIGNRIHILRRLILTFDRVDDMYVLDRVYAVAYGIALRHAQSPEITALARTVINRIFRKEIVVRNIMVRDYAMGIVLLAERYHKLPHDVSQEVILPPYACGEPIPNYPVETIEQLRDEMIQVYGSVMSGDFGIYTMKDVFEFSPTPLSEETPASWASCTEEFEAELIVGNEEFAPLFEELIKQSDEVDVTAGLTIEVAKDLLERIKDGRKDTEFDRILAGGLPDSGEVPKPIEAKDDGSSTEDILAQIDELMTKDQLETRRWLGGNRTDKPALFSRRQAKRWIVHRVKELGWTKERFEEFERFYIRSYGRMEHNAERFGKKYQWIAYYELLARLTDYYHYVASYSDEKTYEGPWQIGRRNIDPSLLSDGKRDEQQGEPLWWQPAIPNLSIRGLEYEPEHWIKDISDLPSDYAGLINVDPVNNQKWFSLYSSGESREVPRDHHDPSRSLGATISSVIVRSDDISELCKKLVGKKLWNRFWDDDYYSGSAFLGEYPWHPVWHHPQEPFEQRMPSAYDEDEIKISFHAPFRSYTWEKGNYDYSMMETFSTTLPSKYIIDELGLKFDFDAMSFVEQTTDQKIWIDPSLAYTRTQAACVNLDVFAAWLRKREFAVLAKIQYDKRYNSWATDHFIGELIDSQLVCFDGDTLSGHRWTTRVESGPVYKKLRKPFKMS